MIKARHNRLYTWFLQWFSRGMLKFHFRDFHIHHSLADSGEAITLIGNHFSWWDGFILAEVNHRIWDRRFHVMMLEEELRKRMFLNRVGAFSIKQEDRSMIESLEYASSLLSDSENLVLLFPQGEIQSKYIRPFAFQQGVQRIYDAAEPSPQIIFSVILVEYFSYIRPRIDVYLKKYDYRTNPDVKEIESSYNDFFEAAIRINDVDR